MDRALGLAARETRSEVSLASAGLRPSLEGTWAVACGCIASGLLHWSDANALRVAAAWLLGDAIMGCVYAQLVALKRLTHLIDNENGEHTPRETGQALLIPYAIQGSPGARLAGRVHDFVAGWREHIGPHVVPHVLSALVASGLALLVATYLGREALGVASVALILAATLALVAGRDDAALARWLAGAQLVLAWILGHLALASWRSLSLGLPLLFGLAAYSRVYLARERSGAARGLRVLLWAIYVVTLLMARHSILAAAVAVVALAETMAGWDVPEKGTLWGESLLGRTVWLAATLIVTLVVARQ